MSSTVLVPNWLTVFLLSLPAFCVGISQGSSWSPASYPNPNVDVNRCGRHGLKSWVCDPDGVVSTDNANMLEGIIKQIHSGEKPYKRGPCGSAGDQGYEVAVALMQEYVLEPGMDAAKTAEHFAKALHTAWGVGHPSCNNGVLVLLSVTNRQIFISTGTGTMSLLNDDVLGDIIQDVRPLLKKGRYGDAVERGVVDVGLALAGQEVKPDTDPDDDKHEVEEEGWFGLGIFLAVICFASGFSWWDGHKKKRRYNDCKSKLEKLKRDQAAARANTYNATSCPVCLEDFTGPDAQVRTRSQDPITEPSAPPLDVEEDGERSSLLKPLTTPINPAPLAPPIPPLDIGATAGVTAAGAVPPVERRPLVLPCGHAFCEPCISQWLETKKVTCPICRKPMDADDVAQEPEPRATLPRPDANTRPDRPDRPDSSSHAHYDSGAAGGSNWAPSRPPCTVEDEETLHTTQTDDGSSSSQLPRLRLRGRRPRGGLSNDMLLAEMLFRVRRLHQQHPQYVTENMVNSMTNDIQTGNPLSTDTIRAFQLLDPTTRHATISSGSSGTSHSFGGGGGGGGGGRGGSW